jgi:hypothetical protein
MASFVHVTDERLLRDIRRAGIKPSRRDFGSYAPPGWPRRYVFCAPVLRDAESTFHWMRELAGPGRGRRGTAVQFRLPDSEQVLVGTFHDVHQVMTAAEAVAAFMRAAPGPRGMQVLVPRAIAPREITGVRAVPSFIGWRYTPFSPRAKPPPVERPSPAARKRQAREDRRSLAMAAAQEPILWQRLMASLPPQERAREARVFAFWILNMSPEELAEWRQDWDVATDPPPRLQAEPGQD